MFRRGKTGIPKQPSVPSMPNPNGEMDVQDFTKADLRNRMVLERRDGVRYLVIDDILMRNRCHSMLSDYDDNLIEIKTQNPRLDIVRVYEEILNYDFLDYTNHLLWERKAYKEITMTEIERKFGCKVKIVNDRQQNESSRKQY